MTTIPAFRRTNLAAGARSWAEGVSRSEPTAVARIVSWTVGAVAGLAAWLIVFGLLLSELQYGHAQSALYGQFRAQLVHGLAPVGGPIANGEPVALLHFDHAGISDQVVVQGTSSGQLMQGPGHYPGSALPGVPGASQIYGRSSSFGKPFARIGSLHKGQVIDVTTGQGQFVYVVNDVRHAGDPLPAPLSGQESQLTLISSEPADYSSGWSSSRLVYVDALLDGQAAVPPAGLSPVRASDAPMASDYSALYPLILWLQLIVIAVVAGIVAVRRWGRWQSWIVAIPLLVAGLWGASGAFWHLLPNVF